MSGERGDSPDGNENRFNFENIAKIAGVAVAVGLGFALIKSATSNKEGSVVEKVSDSVADTAHGVEVKAREFPSKVNLAKENVKETGEKVKSSVSKTVSKGKRDVTKAHRSIIVHKGDTLWALSRKYSVPIDVIRRSNNIPNDLIIAGAEIYIPGAGLLGNSPDDEE